MSSRVEPLLMHAGYSLKSMLRQEKYPDGVSLDHTALLRLHRVHASRRGMQLARQLQRTSAAERRRRRPLLPIT